jgi:pimeloyl-ACP methyl ester carboxylesterase
MRRPFLVFGTAVLAASAFFFGSLRPGAAAEGPVGFSGEKTTWHGFDRYDFVLDEESLAVELAQASARKAKGKRSCIVVTPKKAAPGNPWSWRGFYWDHEPQAEVELLRRGFHVAWVAGDSGKPWDAWYAFLTEKHGLSRKPNFVGMSRGGRNAFTWATANPGKVSCIYADNPAVSPDSLAKLGELARNDVPLLHVCGSIDPLLEGHTLAVEGTYQNLGGRVSVMIKDGAGHHPHSLRDPKIIADFVEQSLRAADEKAPAFVGKEPRKSSYYGSTNSYREFPSEHTFVTCRGPLFAECYDRYEFKLDGVKGVVRVVVPRRPADGKPWVFRADFVGRDAVVDQALLARGFHVVTGPVPYDTNGPAVEQWNAVYAHLVGHGFSRKPVMEGAGGAAGEVLAWAAENPEQVSCVYAENPILRSSVSKRQPLDNLAGLAKARVPLYHVCGSLDPWLESQTRVAEVRYRKLGGPITVVVREGEGHYPLGQKDRQAVVDFILKAVN